MTNLKRRFVLGIDPSGNFKEGKGTTGWALYDSTTDKIIKCGQIQASKFPTQEDYWDNVIEVIMEMHRFNERIVVSMEDYVLYARTAQTLINSGMETSQLIGAIKMACYANNIPLLMRTASAVKRRWTDTILAMHEYIVKAGDSYFTSCYPMPLSDHIRDAIRHAVHCATFELRKVK